MRKVQGKKCVYTEMTPWEAKREYPHFWNGLRQEVRWAMLSDCEYVVRYCDIGGGMFELGYPSDHWNIC